MTGWNEDNFLERLLAQVRQQRGAERNPCPDAETLCAVIGGEAPAALRDQVAEHLRQCPGCTELQKRLLNFDAGASPEPEADWKETRKRLDNWLEGFLRSEAANLRAAKSAATSRKGIRWEAFWSPLLSWKVAWGLAVVALLVLIANGVVVMQLRRRRPPQVQVAAGRAVPQEQPRNAQRAPSLPLAALPSRGGELGVGKAPEAVKSHRHRQNAGAPGGQLATPLPSSLPLNAAPAPPPSLRLEPGVHLLIALNSVKQLADGSFEFRGTLLRPLPQAGPVSLDLGAEVIGAGTIDHGQISLAVTQLVVQGARYSLKGGKGAMKTQAPGSGGPVQFEPSQVLEMWPASASVYEKAPDTPPQP